ncbi:MAG: DUF2238 domain-containing protein [Burkholderiales bacterium]
MLENALVVLFVGSMVATYRKLTLSRISYFLIFVSLSLHLIGAHYTYSLVPYDDWFRAVTGSSLNELVGWERNNFDRVVHFSYGLLLAYPVREVSRGWRDCVVSGATFSRSISPCPPRCSTN